MRQVRCVGSGPASVMRVVTDADIPQPAPGEVRVRVTAAGVNRPDLLQRMGLYPPPLDASPHLGLEIAGTVDALPAHTAADPVSHFAVGQPVCALVAGGGYSEFVCVPAQMLMPVPAGLSLMQAAALPETVMTVWANVVERCGLAPGEVFLVHAGASSIGLTAIAMARALGARVLATVSSQAKADVCLQQGAQAVFIYKDRDWAADVAAWCKATGVGGVDVLLDMVGGSMLQSSLPLMAVEGRVACIAQLDGARCEVDLMRLMLRRLTLTGSTLRARSPQYKAHLVQVLQDRIWPQLQSGVWAPVIHEVFAVERVQDAHAVLERRENCGKVLLQF